jgi:glycine cleavage system transcriptional repressor
MILFALGRDRPGIVDDVSTFLFDRGANIEDSRMTTMGGCFSIMTLFSCSAKKLDLIRKDLETLRKSGLKLSLHEAEDPTTISLDPSLPLKLEVMAIDHPGIVQKIVRVLSRYRVNIESLNTEVIRAPLSGAPMLDLSLESRVPADESISKIKAELTKLSEEMNFDLNYQK